MRSARARRAWQREASRAAIGLGIAAIVGLGSGYVTLCLLVALGAYLLIQLICMYQLHRWLAASRIEPAAGVGVWQEIYAELYRLKRRNRRRKQRLEAIVDEFQASTAALPDGAVVLDAAGRIVWFNDAAAVLLRLRAGADRGQRIVNLIRHPRFVEFLLHDRDDGELEMPAPANEDTTLVVRMVPYGNQQRLLIARDISAQKRLDATRRDFVANASHELRTPLTVLRGYLEMMEAETGRAAELAAWRAPIREMGAQARRMDALIDSLLKLARVEAAGAQARQEAVDVPRLLEALVADVRRGDPARHRFVFDIDPRLALFGRYGEIESVFANVLSNAVRYTPDEGQISLRWWRDDAGVYFAVADTGPGIEAAHIPRLTERFYRVDAGRQSTAGGTGLGLAIVKHGLEHHEGELVVDSTPGEGTTFTCRFPAQRALPLQAA